MPELPEVETVKNTIIRFLKNEVFATIDVNYRRMILNDVEQFKDVLIDKKINDITRIGKYILIHIDGDYVIISHLRMEGKYVLLDQDEKPGKHARIVFTFKSGKRVSYDDSRMFGIMKLVKEQELKDDPLLKKVGPEPFDIHDDHYLYNKYRRINSPIKAAILDQSVMAGLGNIYADEVLFSCGINPRTPASKLSVSECQDIVIKSIAVLNKAIELGGSTIRTYHAARGVDGKFQNELLVYGKDKLPCPKCGYILKKIRVGGRGSTYCPVCQPIKKTATIIALTGVIASGKSTAMSHLADKGMTVYSCDDIVHKLYEQADVIRELEKITRQSLTIDDHLNRLLLRDIIIKNPKIKKRVEQLVHPLVEEKLIELIQGCVEKQIVIEIPLLFEAKLDYLCDYIIGLTANKDIQHANLAKRGCRDIDAAMALYDDSFALYKNKCHYLIEVNGDINDLYVKLDKIMFKIEKDAQ